MSQFSRAMSEVVRFDRTANKSVQSAPSAVLVAALVPVVRKFKTAIAISTMKRLIEEDRAKAKSTFLNTGKTRSAAEIAADLGLEDFHRHRLAVVGFGLRTTSGFDVKQFDRSLSVSCLSALSGWMDPSLPTNDGLSPSPF